MWMESLVTHHRMIESARSTGLEPRGRRPYAGGPLGNVALEADKRSPDARSLRNGRVWPVGDHEAADGTGRVS